MKVPKGVFSAVSGEEPSGWLPNEAELVRQNQEAFDKALREVTANVLRVMEEKAEEFDFGETWWGHQPFGDLSFVSSIAEIVRRIESVLRGSHPNKLAIIEDKAVDLPAYVLAWLAWRKVKNDQLAERPPPNSDQEINRDLVSAETAQEIRRRLLGEDRPAPPRPPDTTGPVRSEPGEPVGIVRRLRKLRGKEEGK